jgi:ribonuclease P/MRP protein subunit POP8
MTPYLAKNLHSEAGETFLHSLSNPSPDHKMTEPITQEHTTMIDAQETGTKGKQKYSRGHEITSLTIKTPPFSYACLELQTASTSPSPSFLDALTIRAHLTSALTQFLGLSGSAISVDILKIEGRECWVRVPRGDLAVFVAAVGGWVGSGEGGSVGWRVRGKGNWLGGLVSRRREEGVWGE